MRTDKNNTMMFRSTKGHCQEKTFCSSRVETMTSYREAIMQIVVTFKLQYLTGQ